MAPLIPKLRGYFAEFLNNASSVGLRILSSTTCVGLRYGYNENNSGFSWHMAHALPYFYFGPYHVFGSVQRICHLYPYLAYTQLSILRLRSPHASPQFCFIAVQESQPVVHRLRLDR